MNEVNLCDEESRILMFQAIAADLQIASQDEAHSVWLDAQAGLTPQESSYMAMSVPGWVN